MSYKELQKLAKAAGIRAKGPKVELLNVLIALNNGNEVENEDETKKKPKGERPKSSKKRKNLVTEVEDDNGNEGENEDEIKEKPKGARTKSTKKGNNPVTDVKGDKYLLISSTGPAADHMCATFGLYRRTEEMKEGRHVYKQEHDSQEEGHVDEDYKLFSDEGVWAVSFDGDLKLKAAKSSKLPTSVDWLYQFEDDEYGNRYDDDDNSAWHNDPALTVTGLSEKPSCECEVTISLDQDIERKIGEPGVAGVYRGDSSYSEGRPVLQHSGGRFTLSVEDGSWVVGDNDAGAEYLRSGSAPSQCPADPKAAIGSEGQGRKKQTFWGINESESARMKRIYDLYAGSDNGASGAKGISVKCNKCIIR